MFVSKGATVWAIAAIGWLQRWTLLRASDTELAFVRKASDTFGGAQ
jgi:hypothetical protein